MNPQPLCNRSNGLPLCNIFFQLPQSPQFKTKCNIFPFFWFLPTWFVLKAAPGHLSQHSGPCVLILHVQLLPYLGVVQAH